MHKVKEQNRGKESHSFIRIIMLAVDVDQYDLGNFQFTLSSVKDYFPHFYQ